MKTSTVFEVSRNNNKKFVNKNFCYSSFYIKEYVKVTLLTKIRKDNQVVDNSKRKKDFLRETIKNIKSRGPVFILKSFSKVKKM